MVSGKLRINLLFALVVLILGITAISSAIRNLNSRNSRQASAPEALQQQLPQNHPPLDVIKKLEALEQVSAKEPRNADYRTQIGNIYYDMGQYEKAAEYYRQSLEIHPGDPNVETDMAACFHYMGQQERALEILDKVLGYSPNFPEAMFNKGIVLMSGKKDVNAGIAVWEDLLRKNPGYPRRAEIEQSIRELKSSAQ
jgi:tetratricopeptide (TPR) repeat protein